MNLQAELGDRYAVDPSLQRLGTIEALREYLAEEIKEMQRHGINPEAVGPADANPNNVLAFYLTRRAPAPTELYHFWDEGDYPDVDADFSTTRRSEVREYLENRFGSDRVMAVATYGGSGVRGALQDLGRVYNVDRESLLRVTKALDEMTKYDMEEGEDETTSTFDWVKENVPGAKELLAKYPELERWTPVYEPIYRYLGKHAAALVVCNEPLFDLLPLAHASSGEPLVALREGSGVKELQPQGFMKFDLLGLSNVDVLHDAERFVEQRHPKIKFNETVWHRIGYDWPEAYRLARIGDLDGIFQLEGPAGRRATQIVQPESFDEIVFISAAMRPGAAAAKAAETFYMAKQDQWPEGYPDYRDLKHYRVDERFIKFMAETRGILCVRGDALVTTEDGDVPIKSLVGQSGLILPSFNINENHFEADILEACWTSGESTIIIEIELEDGTVLPLTPEHLVLTKDGYKKACQLTRKDRVVCGDD